MKEILTDVVKVMVNVLKDTAVVNMVGVERVKSIVEQVVNQNLVNVMKLLVLMEDVVVYLENVQKVNVVVNMVGVEPLVNIVT
jgi:protein gp37